MLETFENRLLFAVFTVNSTADTVDADPTVTTLREAILASNAAAGADTINFNLPLAAGADVATIFVQSALPVISDTVTIDGSSQPNPDSLPHPRVQVDGSDLSAVPTDGLVVDGNASGSTIK
jgi:CSLREA domain-containing protein